MQNDVVRFVQLRQGRNGPFRRPLIMRPLQLRHGECFANGRSLSQWHYVKKNVIDIIGRTKRDVTAVFNAIEWKSTKINLAVNEGKTKHMLSANTGFRRIDSLMTADNYTFDAVKEFIYLGFPPKMMSIWRSNVGSILPTGATMVSMVIE